MGTLRVISGWAKGARLKTVPGDSTRPITDQIKEALFNILGSDIQDSTWLDLFGGTGAVGIEALSRGAEFVTFIEINHQAIKVIRDNLHTTRLQDKAEVYRRDAFDFIKAPIQRSFNYIYIAPPQYKDMWKKAMMQLDEDSALLADDGEIIVQINPIEWETLLFNNFFEIEQRHYGDTMLIFFGKNQSNEITNSSLAL